MKRIATAKGLNAILLFIAELNGFKKGTVEDKRNHGQQCYLTRTSHNLDYSTEEGRKEAHENIWLFRLYDELDRYFQLDTMADLTKQWVLSGKRKWEWLEAQASTNYYWIVPIELDASASMLAYIGALLGDERLLSMTNAHGTDLSDPWEFPGIPRTQFKHAATPMLYGSSKPCHDLWQAKGHKYTLEQVKAFNNELASGPLGLANAFKDFLITNCKPQAQMQVHIINEHFTIECNRFRNVGEKTNVYAIYDTDNNAIRTIHHTDTVRVPDLEQFRRYFPTLLIF